MNHFPYVVLLFFIERCLLFALTMPVCLTSFATSLSSVFFFRVGHILARLSLVDLRFFVIVQRFERPLLSLCKDLSVLFCHCATISVRGNRKLDKVMI